MTKLLFVFTRGSKQIGKKIDKVNQFLFDKFRGVQRAVFSAFAESDFHDYLAKNVIK